MTVGRVGSTAAGAYRGRAAGSATAGASTWSTSRSSPSPTSAAQLANAMICSPGNLAPTGVPGLTANDQSSSGQRRISWANFTRTVSTSPSTWSARRSGDV